MKNSKKDLTLTPVYMKNVFNGEMYVTCKEWKKKDIDGVSFTPIHDQRGIRYIRSDSLKRVAKAEKV